MTIKNIENQFSNAIGKDVHLPAVLLDWVNSESCQEFGDVCFFSLGEMFQENLDYRVLENIPGYFMFGGDGGAKQVFMEFGEDARCIFFGATGVGSVGELSLLADDFDDWAKGGFKIEEDEAGRSAIDDVHIVLSSYPLDGVKKVAKIKKLLNVNFGIGEINILKNGGSIKLIKTSYIKAVRYVKEINIDEELLLIIDPETGEKLSVDIEF